MIKEIEIRQECCNIWNNLKDKNQMIDYLIESKLQLADLEAKLAESEDRIAKARRQAYSSRQMDNTLKIRRLADEITAKEKAITKLKQQLEEKDQTIEGLQEINQSLGQTCNNDAKEIERLREKLANTTVFAPKISNNAELILKIIESDSVGIDFLKQSQNQTAIEELEKVKEEFTSEVWDMYDTPDLLEQICEFKNKQIQYIDQQIRVLKGEN